MASIWADNRGSHFFFPLRARRPARLRHPSRRRRLRSRPPPPAGFPLLLAARPLDDAFTSGDSLFLGEELEAGDARASPIRARATHAARCPARRRRTPRAPTRRSLPRRARVALLAPSAACLTPRRLSIEAHHSFVIVQFGQM
ncbi:hypothetical protein PVAP13_3NG258244 [Panicum virgatum]|uniref:Uncharacterized protein n=1 Tax=Panicum virgatum TaxID=38727 RepID=A0A8T0UBW0_PANVG|nr:hypothetical protein PVAP13_3NG258244 [Panicum virgatum]